LQGNGQWTHITAASQTEVTYVSRGKVLVRVFESRTEISTFFVEHPFHLSYCLSSFTQLQNLAYFAGIFTVVNKIIIN
jgi:hypothetical protein